MKFRLVIKSLVAALLLTGVIVSPTDMDAARRKSRTSTSASSGKKSKKKKSSSSRSSKGKSRNTSSRRRSSGSSARTGSADYTLPTASSTVNPVGKAPRKPSDTSLRKIVVGKPDLEEIRKATLNPESKMYFPKLMEKYQRNDTTMTAEEYRNFYLGYMFQEDYDPYRTSPYSGLTDSLRLKKTHTKEEIDTIRKYAELSLRDNPFDLRQMSFLVHVLKEKRKDMTAKIWEYRLEQLLGAIKSTGTGEDVDNAWYVIYPMHEYDVIQLLGYEATDVEFIEPGFDYLVVQPDGTQRHAKPAEGFYFNIQIPQQQYDLKHPEDAEETEDSEESEALEIIEDNL